MKLKHSKSLTDQVKYYKAKCSDLKLKLNTCTDCDVSDKIISDLEQEIKYLEDKNILN